LRGLGGASDLREVYIGESCNTLPRSIYRTTNQYHSVIPARLLLGNASLARKLCSVDRH
jgi:hypothetical protein